MRLFYIYRSGFARIKTRIDPDFSAYFRVELRVSPLLTASDE